MPVLKSLKKIEQKIKKNDHVHVKGRKFKQLNRATVRDQKLKKQAQERQNAQAAKLSRYHYFQDILTESGDDATYTLQDIKKFILAFINRDNDELETLKGERRPGRPPTNRQLFLQNKLDREMKEFKAGYKVPDIRSPENCKKLKEWNGTTGGLNQIQMIFVSEKVDEVSEAPEGEAVPMEE